MIPQPSNDWLSDRGFVRDLARKPTAIPVIMVNPVKSKPAPKQRRELKAPITFVQADQRGYHGLTTLYAPDERWMLENVVADMERGGIDYQLVGYVDQFDNHRVYVVRKGMTWVNKDGSPRYGSASPSLEESDL